MPHRNFLLRILTLASVLVLAACDQSADGVDGLSLDDGQTGGQSPVVQNITGSVGDGPIVFAEVLVYSQDGRLIGSGASDGQARYDIAISAIEADYPLTIVTNGGRDVVTNRAPDFSMSAAAMSTAENVVANINPFSTLIVETAGLMGGLTQANVDAATQTVVGEFNSGLTTLADSSPMTTAIDDSNVAEIVRASEALAEILRRANTKWLLANGTSDIATIIAALSADLVDGTLDGEGSAGTSDRISAMTTVVSSQVVLETMANRLRVDSLPADAALNNAINLLASQPSESPTASLPVSEAMLEQAERGLDAVLAIGEDTEIEAVRQSLNALPAGTAATDVGWILRVQPEGFLEGSISQISAGPQDTVDAVNGAVRRITSNEGGDTPAVSDNPLTLSGTPVTMALVGQSYQFQPDVSGDGAGSAQFSVQNAPDWTVLNENTGQLSGTPGGDDVGTHAGVFITAVSGSQFDTIGPFSITVVQAEEEAPNSAPLISGNPPTSIVAGSFYQFTPQASDAEGDDLTFSIRNRPSWLSFNQLTGRVSGTPDSGDVGTYLNVRIRVSDGTTLSQLGAFNITVSAPVVPDQQPEEEQPEEEQPEQQPEEQPEEEPPVEQEQPNRAPSISGAPQNSVLQGQGYVFVPNASDPDNDNLTFSASNLPGWASLNPQTGRLSGTPSANQVGVYTGITIFVSDGEATDQLGPFTIEVEALTVGSAMLSWAPPTQNTDGSTLDDLVGYVVYWGLSENALVFSEVVDGQSTTSYDVEDLTNGTWFFAVTALNQAGMESSLSDTVSKTIE